MASHHANSNLILDPTDSSFSPARGKDAAKPIMTRHVVGEFLSKLVAHLIMKSRETGDSR